MWFSRVWLALLAAAVALGLGAALTAPKPGRQALAEASSYKLDLVQHNAQLLLKLKARELIDGATGLARDPRLVEILEQASAKQKDLEQLRQRSQAVITKLLQPTPAAARPKLAIVVDFAGKQIGRLGPGSDKLKPGRDGLVGYPLVAAALRGYTLDDSWSVDNRLFLMAAAPIVSRGRNRYVGALILGQEVAKSFAKQLKRELVGETKGASTMSKVEIAFFLRGKLLSTSAKVKEIDKLPQRFSRDRAKLLRQQRSRGFTIGKGSAQHIAVIAPMRGGAVDHDAFYAVLTPTPPAAGLLATLGKLSKRDLPPGLWLLLGGAFLGLLIIGLLLLRVEHSGPLNRFVERVNKLVRNDISRMEEHAHRAQLQRLARLINEIIDRAPRRSGKDIGKILDDEAPTPGFPSTFVDQGAGGGGSIGAGLGGGGAVAHGGAMPPLAAGGSSGPPSMGVIASAGVEVDGPEVDRLPSPAEGVMPLTSLDGPSDGAMPQLESPAAAGFSDGLGGGPGEDPKPFSLDPLGGPSDALPSLTPMSLPDTEPAPADEAAALGASLEVQVTTTGKRDETRPGPFSSTTPTSFPAVDPAARTGGDDPNEQERYFREIYDEFIAIKRSCGESTDNVTFERFSAKLKKNRQSLMERYECHDVRFRVYIKDGKAALKATPVTD